MDLKELAERLHLEDHHYEEARQATFVLDPGVYNTLGRQLFEVYQKYEIPKEDQRKIEAICFLLVSKNLSVEPSPKSGLKSKIKALFNFSDQ